jgi:PAS domain S-box-containing protein
MQTLNNPALASLIVENALDYAIFTLDFEGRITSWSPGAERILGYADAEIVGLNMSVMFLPSDVAAGADRLELQTVQSIAEQTLRATCRSPGPRRSRCST